MDTQIQGHAVRFQKCNSAFFYLHELLIVFHIVLELEVFCRSIFDLVTEVYVMKADLLTVIWHGAPESTLRKEDPDR